MEINFFTAWFVVSSFVLLNRVLKIEELKRDIRDLYSFKEKFDLWDRDYKELLTRFHSVDNFVESYAKDMNIFRSNFALVYKELTALLAVYDNSSSKMIELCKEFSKEDVETSLKVLKDGLDRNVSAILANIAGFLKNEEEAHSGEKRIEDILKDIDKKYKDNDFYKDTYSDEEE